jgi:hypothetical protein
MKKSYPYWVGALQAATRVALIHLKHGHTEDAVWVLRKVLTQVDEDLSIKTPERTEP